MANSKSLYIGYIQVQKALEYKNSLLEGSVNGLVLCNQYYLVLLKKRESLCCGSFSDLLKSKNMDFLTQMAVFAVKTIFVGIEM